MNSNKQRPKTSLALLPNGVKALILGSLALGAVFYQYTMMNRYLVLSVVLML